jgi:hypothetical protein
MYTKVLRLPGELRNRIYEYVFRGRRYRLCKPMRYPCVRDYFEKHQCALLLVCKTLHRETALLPLSWGVCNFGSLDTLHIYGLLLSQDQRAAIKSVEVSHDVIDEVDKCLPFTHMGEWRD